MALAQPLILEQRYHGIHARGEKVEEVLQEFEKQGNIESVLTFFSASQMLIMF